MAFGRTAFSILRGAKAHNGSFQHLTAHSSRSRIYSPTSASRDWTRLALRRPFASHRVEKSGKDQGDVAASSGVKKVHKFFLLPCHGQNGGLTLTDLKAEIAKALGSYDLAEKFSYCSFDNDFNGITATLTEDQVESIKKSLKVISVMDDRCDELFSIYDLAEKFSYCSFDNDFNGITATLTEDQVESIKKSLKVISVMDDSCLKLHRM